MAEVKNRFTVPKVVNAKDIAAEFEGELVFSAFTARELKEIRKLKNDDVKTDSGESWMDLVDSKFIKGTINGLDVKAADLQDLPVEMYELAIKAMQGNLTVPKSQL